MQVVIKIFETKKKHKKLIQKIRILNDSKKDDTDLSEALVDTNLLGAYDEKFQQNLIEIL